MIIFNYKKEGFFQIFPFLYLNTELGKAIVIGFGRKNITFLLSEQKQPEKNKEVKKKETKSSYGYGGSVSFFDKPEDYGSINDIKDPYVQESKIKDFLNLSPSAKAIVCVVGGLACFVVLSKLLKKK